MTNQIIKFQQPGRPFHEYSPAYLVTNEDLRWINSLITPERARVLTVAASGDHPLFYQLGDATFVDTFDISYCARVVMDMKCAAIQVLNHTEYTDLLSALFGSRPISSTPNMDRVMERMPAETREFILQHDSDRIFGNGVHPRYNISNMPTLDEYQTLKQKTSLRFRFTQCDLKSLATKLTSRYDIINLSNIFEYEFKTNVVAQILNDLLEFVTPGGHIIVQQGQMIPNDHIRMYHDVNQQMNDRAKMLQATKSKNTCGLSPTAIILQKSR